MKWNNEFLRSLLGWPKYDWVWLEKEIKIKIGLLEDGVILLRTTIIILSFYLFIYKFGNASKVPITKTIEDSDRTSKVT